MNLFLNLLFPRRCLGCNRAGDYFCHDCLKTTEVLSRQVCPACGKASIYGRTHVRCRPRQAMSGLISIFAYSGLIKVALGKLKYRYLTDLSREMVELTAMALEEQIKVHCLLKKVIMVPVPLHSLKKRKRGFNQAELLGNLLAERMNWAFEPDCLRRIRYTKPQVKLKRKGRQENVKGAFGLETGFSILRKGNYLIFDDVWTSGSTMKECAKVLKKAGAGQIWGLTIAR